MMRKGEAVDKIDTIDLGLYVGFVEDISKSLNVMQVRMAPGDMVMLYTDGATEAENSQGVEFGIDRLASSLKNNAADTPEAIIKAVMEDIAGWIGGYKKFDDINSCYFQKNDIRLLLKIRSYIILLFRNF